MSKPNRSEFTKKEWQIIQVHRTPRDVQRFLSTFPYNSEYEGGTLRSFRETVKRGEAHCLEAALTAAVILEQYDYPPLLLSFESQDKLDHVVYLFRQRGQWGSIGRSGYVGLNGRRPVFRNVRQLVWSYFDPYIDYTGRIIGYAVTNLNALGRYNWRFSSKNVWKVENHLREIQHHPLRSSNRRYEKVLDRFKKFKEKNPDELPSHFENRNLWMI
jgi:hypothetical protein